jgi:hypothetical protein
MRLESDQSLDVVVNSGFINLYRASNEGPIYVAPPSSKWRGGVVATRAVGAASRNPVRARISVMPGFDAFNLDPLRVERWSRMVGSGIAQHFF